VIAVAVLGAGIAGCGGGGRKRVVPTECLAFQGHSAPAASTVVARQGSGSLCESVQVELVLTDVADVQTVDFTVDYDFDVARYEGLSIAGSVLTSGGATVNVLENESPGKVSIDLTRFGTGVDFNGSGSVVRLIFSPVSGAAPATSTMSFASPQIFGSETPPQEKPGIQWFGGELQLTVN